MEDVLVAAINQSRRVWDMARSTAGDASDEEVEERQEQRKTQQHPQVVNRRRRPT